MKHTKAFFLGFIEFRSSYGVTWGNSPSLSSAYDWGREWAHRLTFRHFEL